MIEAGAGGEPGSHLVVIASNDLRRRHGLDAIDDGVGVGAVADQVAEDEHAIEALAGGGGEHGVERLEVRVDVADDEVTHQKPIQASRRSTTSSTGREPSIRTCAC